MLLPDLSKLALAVEVKRKQPDSDSEPDTEPAFSLPDTPPYRSLGPPSKRATLVSKILVRSIRILPRPPNAVRTYTLMEMALESFADFVLNTSEPFTDEVFEENLEKWVRTNLTLEDGPLEYNRVMMFMGYYITLSSMAINASGPPDAPWGGPITYPELYPIERSIEIWNAIVASSRHEAVKAVLNSVCPGAPQHPWYNIDDKSRRMGTFPFIDTMGGIIDMTSEVEPVFTRELLIATRDNEFMGHVFVSYANQPFGGIKGLMPYGIQRSAFYLPGTCAPPIQASGFVDALFGRIGEIAYENGVTHIFTWPLKKMKERFVSMGYVVVKKRTKIGLKLDDLKSAVWSIYGVGSDITGFILDRELQSWDFVLLAL